MKTTTITFSKTEFVKKGNKYYYKELSRSTKEEPSWWPVCEQLKSKNLTDYEIAIELNKKGFKSKHGKPLNVDMIRSYRKNSLRAYADSESTAMTIMNRGGK